MAARLAGVDVVGVGLNALDTILRVRRFPSRDSKVEVLTADVRPGGQVASAIAACQQWGLRTRYVGKAGDDEAGESLRREMVERGVEGHLLTVKDCRSQIAFIVVEEESGERTILWKRDARLEVLPEELHRDWITQARALHVDGHDTAAAALAARWAREVGISVTVDVDNVYPGIEALLENVDYLLASREFPPRLLGEPDALKSLPALKERFGCRVTGITLGARGALAWDGQRFLYCPGYRVRAVDTTGAGDIFHGGWLYGTLAGWGVERCLEFSCAAAALNCEAVGSRSGIRPVQEIERLMREGARSEMAYDPSELAQRRGAAPGND